ncbi:MAG: hypothetical protein JW749_02580 [Sedimentisphaerales bacterium]|nr:hypothetical protein [Sedimentisphaerales bacterium]
MKSLELRIKNEELKAGDCVAGYSVLNSRFLIGVAVFVFMTLMAGIGRAEGELRFRFKAGDKYFLTSVVERKSIQLVGGKEIVSEQMQRLGCDLDIEEVDENDCAWARYTYRRAALKRNAPDANFEFDSNVNSPKLAILAIPTKAAVGEGFYVRITPQGRLTNINGLVSVVSAAKGKIPPNLASREELWRTIEKQYGEDTIRRTLEEQFAVFPDANVNGDENRPNVWSRTDRVEKGGATVLTEKTFQLREVVNDIGLVDVNLVVSSGPNTDQIVQSGVLVRYKVSGLGQGTVEIEQSSGRIKNYRLTQHIVESVEATAKGPVLRLPPVSEPIHTYINTSFQMTKRD